MRREKPYTKVCPFASSASICFLTRFIIAAFLSIFRPNAFLFANTAIFDDPRSTICVGGAENGRLSLDVINISRSLRFFFMNPPLLSPSMSASGRCLLRLFCTGG
jgi:hypothetical protein